MPHEADFDTRQAVEISQRLHEHARTNAGVLWLAIDAPNDNAGHLAGHLESAFEEKSTLVVPLPHPSVDAAWRPRWLRLDTSTTTGSLLLQESIAQALAEADIDRLRSGQGRRISGWIQLGEDDPAKAMAHVAREMIRRGPAGAQRLVRLHDPAVLWALWPLLSAAQQRQLLGPIDCWMLLDPIGDVARLQSANHETEAAWSPGLWQDVDSIMALNAALRSSVADTAFETSTDLERARVAVTSALRRARAMGFSHPRDLAEFARHTIAVHPEFDRHPLVMRALESRSSDDHYLALIDSLSKDDWREVGNSMNAA